VQRLPIPARWGLAAAGLLTPVFAQALTLSLQGPVLVPESAGTVTFSVVATREASDPPTLCDVSGELVTADGTAVDGVDFTGGIFPIGIALDINDASGTATFDIAILDDGEIEGDEQFSLSIQNENGGNCPVDAVDPRTLTVTIQDDDSTVDPGPDVNVNAAPGDTIDIPFTVTGAGAPFTLSTQIGSVAPTTLPAPGTATFTYTVPIDAQIGSTIVATVTVTDAVGFPSTKDFVIQVVDPERALSEIPGLTPNQRALARYLDVVCPRLDAQGPATDEQGQLQDACNGLRDTDTTDGQVRAALDAINPEELIVAATTALRLTSMQNGNLMDRINALRSGATGIDLAGLDFQIGNQRIAGSALNEVLRSTLAPVVGKLLGGAAGADDFARWGLFANGSVKFGDKDATENEAGFDYDSISVTLGADYRFRDNLIFGLAAGYVSVESDYDRSGGELDIDGFNLSLFGTYFQADSFYLDGMFTWGTNDYDTVRNIEYTDAFGTVQARTTGNTDGMQFSGGLSGGFDFNRGPWTFGPHAGAYYFDVDVDGFRESGGGAFDFEIGDQNAQSFQVNAGGHLSYVVNTSWGVLIPHARFDWVHELEDNAETVGVRLVNDPFSLDPNDPTPIVELRTDRPDSDYFVWSLGASAQFINGVSGFLSYRSAAGFDDFTMHDISWGLRFEKSF
jgi:outer membrane autotransporter protein